MTTSSQRVLIVSASAGAGHVRAADALLQEFQHHPAIVNGGQVQHWDLLNYTTKTFRQLYTKGYLGLINKTPTLFGLLYAQTNAPWKNEKVRLAFEKSNAKPFLRALHQYQPDLVVCTHFTPGFLLSDLFAQGTISHKPAIVITDLDVHATWLARHYQHYFVSIPESQIYLQRLGIDPAKITVSGIPIDPVFRLPKDQLQMRTQFSLDPQRFTILVSGGGFGVGPIDQLIEELLALKVPAQVVAIAGKSETLKSRLDVRAAAQTTADPVRLIPVGFTRQMDEYMAAADILISKPGGLTTSEAMAR